MALFPAYSQGNASQEDEDWDQLQSDNAERSLLDVEPGSPPSPCHERELLRDPILTPVPPVPPPPSMDFYEDRKRDPANISVSTLYYPGRPQYIPRKCKVSEERKRRRRVARYYSRRCDVTGAGVGEARGARYRAALEAGEGEGEGAGAGARVWEEYIHYLEYYMEDLPSALQAAEEAIKRGVDVGDTWHRLLQALLSPAQYAEKVKDILETVSEPDKRVVLWIRLVIAVANAGACGGIRAAARAAARASDDAKKARHLYAAMLHTYGCILRNAGLWEEMVQLVELVLSVGGAGGGGGALDPTPGEARAEEELDHYEMKLIGSGLPLGEVWRRVELSRAALHWRPLPPAAPEAQADPQRAPSPGGAADLLRPITDAVSWFRVCVWSVLSCEAILPGSQRACLSIWGCEELWLAHVDTPAAVLQLLYSGRKLPVGEERVKELMAVLPARNYSKYLNDPSGFGTWVDSVWTRCFSSTSGPARLALLLMKLRGEVNRVRHLTIQGNTEEARRVISTCRLLIKKWGDNAALPLAMLGRAEAAALGRGRPPSGTRAGQLLRRALNAALIHEDTPDCQALYIARVLSEVSADSTLSSWAVVSAVLRRPLPDDVTTPPPKELKELALQRCKERCAHLESQYREETGHSAIWESVTCSPIEWGSARITLLSGEERGRLLREISREEAQGRMAAYLEHCACALLDKASYQEKRQFVHLFADRFPCNTYLAMMSAECSNWWSAPSAAVGTVRAAMRGLAGAVRGGRGRGGRGAQGGLAGGLLAVTKGPVAIERALSSSPGCRWLYLVPGAAPLARADLLLANQLRIHALPDELTPLE